MTNIIKVPANSTAYLTAVRNCGEDKFDVTDFTFNYSTATFPAAWAYWKLEEASGSRADATGNNRPLNVPDSPVGNTTGKLNNAALFPGDSGTLQNLSTQTERPTMAANWTSTFWINLHRSATGAVEGYMEFGGGSPGIDGAFGFQSGQTNGYLEVYAGSLTVASGNTITPDAWHFVAVFYDGSTLTLEIDNAQVNTDTGVAGISGSAAVTWGGISPNNKMTCALDEWGIWDGIVLTADQRSQLYNAGNGWSPY